MIGVCMNHSSNTYVLCHVAHVVRFPCNLHAVWLFYPTCWSQPKREGRATERVGQNAGGGSCTASSDCCKFSSRMAFLTRIVLKRVIDRNMSLTCALNTTRYHPLWSACKPDAVRHSGLTSLPLPFGRNVSGMSAGESKSGQGKGSLLRRIQERFPTQVSWDSVGLTWTTSRHPTFYRYLAGRSLCEPADR